MIEAEAPAGIEVDAAGNVWVGDTENDRIQVFDQQGAYIGKLGSPGEDDGEFNFAAPMGIASDEGGGRIWVTDTGNHRIQEWASFEYIPGPEGEGIVGDDPRVEIDVEDGLVDSVEGEEAGEHTYEHEGELLVSYEGPQGETAYDYDEENRLTGIELPNGTTATVVYDTTYGWVKSVTVDPAGSDPAKTTHFSYSIEPRRTTVTAPGVPVTAYDIGGDGSVLKWWNAVVPPDFDDLAGSLWSERETQSPIPAGDHNLVVQAHSEHGIASIEIIADGDQLISEQTCEQDPEKEGIECVTLVDEWVTNTDVHPPGNLDLEVLITDELGNSASERFWVNIPEPPPPPPPGALVPPKFHEILRFREEYGLEVVFPVANELELNNRIFDLIGAWHNPHTPAGTVAWESWRQWGVPLRPADVAELEFRETYVAQAAGVIPVWSEANRPNSYAGYWIDHPAGGKLRIGFTDDQSSAVSELEPLLTAPADRVMEFSYQPTHSLDMLSDTEEDLVGSLESTPSIEALVTRTEPSIPTNKVSIGTLNVATLNDYIETHFGASSPFTAFFSPQPPSRREGERERPLSHELWAGDWIRGKSEEGSVSCSLGFGATETRQNKPNGQRINGKFAFTAGHCFVKNAAVLQRGLFNDELGEHDEQKIGSVLRRTFFDEYGDFVTDGELIRLESGFFPPRRIYLRNHTEFTPVKGAEKVVIGSTLCTSGITTGVSKCGAAKGPFRVYYGGGFTEWVIATNALTDYGDSGGPVWNKQNGKGVGLVSGGPRKTPSETWFSPLRPVKAPDGDVLPGLLELLDGKGPKAVGPLKMATFR